MATETRDPRLGRTPTPPGDRPPVGVERPADGGGMSRRRFLGYLVGGAAGVAVLSVVGANVLSGGGEDSKTGQQGKTRTGTDNGTTPTTGEAKTSLEIQRPAFDNGLANLRAIDANSQNALNTDENKYIPHIYYDPLGPDAKAFQASMNKARDRRLDYGEAVHYSLVSVEEAPGATSQNGADRQEGTFVTTLKIVDFDNALGKYTETISKSTEQVVLLPKEVDGAQEWLLTERRPLNTELSEPTILDIQT